MTAVPVQVRRTVRPTCDHCGRGIRLANSLRAGRCCCIRGTCNTGEAVGCMLCAREIDGLELVLGVCTKCSVVNA